MTGDAGRIVPKDSSFKDFVLDQLDGLGTVRARAMFGGYGLYLGDIFFGIIHRGRLYFRTSPVTLPEYRAHGMKPFRPSARQTLAAYHEVPLTVLEDPTELNRWARKAAERP